MRVEKRVEGVSKNGWQIKLLDNHMENYLFQENYDILDEENCIDSTKVFDVAIELLGYEPYRLDGEGELHDTYLFVKREVAL